MVAAICNGSWEDGVDPWPCALSVGNQRPPAAGRGEDLLTCGDVETNPGPHSVLHPTGHYTSQSVDGLPTLPSKGEHHWVRDLPMDGDVERNPGPTSAAQSDWGLEDLMVEVEVDMAEPVNAELQTLLDTLETGVEAASQQVHDPAMLGVLSGLFLEGLHPVARNPPLFQVSPASTEEMSVDCSQESTRKRTKGHLVVSQSAREVATSSANLRANDLPPGYLAPQRTLETLEMGAEVLVHQDSTDMEVDLSQRPTGHLLAHTGQPPSLPPEQGRLRKPAQRTEPCPICSVPIQGGVLEDLLVHVERFHVRTGQLVPAAMLASWNRWICRSCLCLRPSSNPICECGRDAHGHRRAPDEEKAAWPLPCLTTPLDSPCPRLQPTLMQCLGDATPTHHHVPAGAAPAVCRALATILLQFVNHPAWETLHRLLAFAKCVLASEGRGGKANWKRTTRRVQAKAVAFLTTDVRDMWPDPAAKVGSKRPRTRSAVSKEDRASEEKFASQIR